MSGRTLRRLPVLAHARYIAGGAIAAPLGSGGADEEDVSSDEMEEEESENESCDDEPMSTISDWVSAMERVVTEENEQIGKLEELVGTGKI